MSGRRELNYAKEGATGPVVKPGEFIFAAAHLDHGHIYGQTEGLLQAGGQLKSVYDPDPAKVAAFQQKHPSAKVAATLDEILDDQEIQLVAAAAVPCDRGPIGCRVLAAGKDYFTDKAPFTSLEQLLTAREEVAKTGQKFMVYFSERLHSEAAVCAGDLIEQGAVGRVIQVLGLGPHRLNASTRPAWFFERKKYGGILCDLGSHQIEQFLFFSGATDAAIAHSATANYDHHEYPSWEDFGEASLIGNNGTSHYLRVDWLTPDGLRSWGDGRSVILGTKGYIELRKYIDVAAEKLSGDHVFLIDEKGESHFAASGKVGFPFFGQLILDCLNRTEKAMTQEHTFKAAELCLRAQLQAKDISIS